jgi:hypothetical protein
MKKNLCRTKSTGHKQKDQEISITTKFESQTRRNRQDNKKIDGGKSTGHQEHTRVAREGFPYRNGGMDYRTRKPYRNGGGISIGIH